MAKKHCLTLGKAGDPVKAVSIRQNRLAQHI